MLDGEWDVWAVEGMGVWDVWGYRRLGSGGKEEMLGCRPKAFSSSTKNQK